MIHQVKKWKLIILMLCCSMIGVCGKYLYDYFAQSAENKNAYADIIDIGFSDRTDNQHVDGHEGETERETEECWNRMIRSLKKSMPH